VIPLTERFVSAVLDPQPWALDAACREHAELDWFPARGAPHAEQKAVCDSCLVRAECLAYAMSLTPMVEGVWGGTSTRQRRTLIAQARRAVREATR